VDRAYRQSIRAISLVLVAVGIAMVVATLARGGEPLDVGVLLGVMLAGLGVARFAMARGGGSSS
jgi:hypothetical protein